MRSTSADRACIANGECRPRHRSAKKTRRWCKGKPGVEHVWEWLDYSARPNHPNYAIGRKVTVSPVVWQIRVCATCGKQGYQFRYIHRGCGGVLTPVDADAARSLPTGLWFTANALQCDTCLTNIPR